MISGVMWPLNVEVHEGTCRCGLGNCGSDCGGNCCCIKATWIEIFDLDDLLIFVQISWMVMDILLWHQSCGIEAFFFFVLLTAHLRVFRWETASNCRRPRLQMAAYLKWVFGMPNGCRVLAAWCKYIEGCHRFFAFACFCIYSWTKRADTRNQMQISNMLLQVHGRCSQKDSIFRPSKLTSGFLQAVDKVKRLLSKQKQRLAGINTGYLCQGVPLGHNICFDMSQFSGRSTDLSIAADTLLVIEASADTTWQICSLETPQHHITQTRCIAVSSFQLHGFIAEEPQIQLMLHQTKGEGVKSTVLRQCKQHLNSFS